MSLINGIVYQQKVQIYQFSHCKNLCLLSIKTFALIIISNSIFTTIQFTEENMDMINVSAYSPISLYISNLSLQYQSNARFVRWSDDSLQLLIGNEVLDISVQNAQHDQSHLFLRHGKVTSDDFMIWENT